MSLYLCRLSECFVLFCFRFSFAFFFILQKEIQINTFQTVFLEEKKEIRTDVSVLIFFRMKINSPGINYRVSFGIKTRLFSFFAVILFGLLFCVYISFSILYSNQIRVEKHTTI